MVALRRWKRTYIRFEGADAKILQNQHHYESRRVIINYYAVEQVLFILNTIRITYYCLDTSDLDISSVEPE